MTGEAGTLLVVVAMVALLMLRAPQPAAAPASRSLIPMRDLGQLYSSPPNPGAPVGDTPSTLEDVGATAGRTACELGGADELGGLCAYAGRVATQQGQAIVTGLLGGDAPLSFSEGTMAGAWGYINADCVELTREAQRLMANASAPDRALRLQVLAKLIDFRKGQGDACAVPLDCAGVDKGSQFCSPEWAALKRSLFPAHA